jgi:hypothetical protein
MKNPRLFPSLVIAALFMVALLTAARADDSASTIKFSDPTKPGTVKIILARGDLRVQAADTSEVAVKTDVAPETTKPRKDGLRVISASSGYALSEKDNVVTLNAASEGMFHGNSNFQLTVPRNSSVIVQNAWGGDVTCSGLNGDIEINSMHGEIRLDDVAGGVVVGTMNGEIHANIRELREGKPLSFTSMNGEVVLRISPTAKANIRLRTQNGAVLTDFDETALVTKTESAGPTPRRGRAFTYGRGVLPPEAQDALRDAARMSVQAVEEATRAIKQGVDEATQDHADAAREKAEAARGLEEAKRGAEQAKRAAAEAKRQADRGGSSTLMAAPLPPMPPMPPTISGGKLVTGTLNGGGPEISVSTMNGDVTLRKLEQK